MVSGLGVWPSDSVEPLPSLVAGAAVLQVGAEYGVQCSGDGLGHTRYAVAQAGRCRYRRCVRRDGFVSLNPELHSANGTKGTRMNASCSSNRFNCALLPLPPG